MGDLERELTIKASTSGMPEAKAQIEELNASVKATGDASTTAASGALKGEAGLKALQAEMKATVAEAGALAAEEGAVAAGATGIAAGLSSAVPQIAAIVIAMELLSKVGQAVKSVLSDIYDRVRLWALGLSDLKPILDEHGKAIDPLSDKYQKAADAAALLERAQNAMRAGLNVLTEDTRRANAEEIVRQAALHGTIGTTKEYADALKTLGIRSVESFNDLKGSAQAFEREYERIFKTEGPAAARFFAQENAALLDKVETRYEKLGQDVPAELHKIATSIGLVSKAESELAKNTELEKKYEKTIGDLKEKFSDLSKALADSGKAFLDHASKIEVDRAKAVEAINDTTSKTISGLQAQVKETEAAHQARAISDSEYNQKINTLFAEQAKAKTEGYEKEKAVDDKATKDLADLTEKHAEETRKRKENLQEVADAEVAAQKKLESLNAARNEEIRALAAAKPLLFQAGVDTKSLADSHTVLAPKVAESAAGVKDLGQQITATAAQVPALKGQVDSLKSSLDALLASALAAAKAVASIPDGGA
jgi:chromosome segregation ATPase